MSKVTMLNMAGQEAGSIELKFSASSQTRMQFMQ